MDLKLTPYVFFLFCFVLLLLLAYRMARGYEEVSSSQVRCRRVIPRETPTASSIVVAMFVEELRLYS